MKPQCANCYEPAEYNFQEVWITYALEDDEKAEGGYKYIELDATNSGDNLFYCQKCAEDEGYI